MDSWKLHQVFLLGHSRICRPFVLSIELCLHIADRFDVLGPHEDFLRALSYFMQVVVLSLYILAHICINVRHVLHLISLIGGSLFV